MGLEMIDAGWLSVIPPLLAILLAVFTKEVYSSLLVGIISGMLIYCLLTGSSVLAALQYTIDMMAGKIGQHAYMIIFLALLGSLVVVVTKAGGSRAYSKWASERLNNPRKVKLVTLLLGVLIFIDDYFNCLTIGTVMRPVSDKFKIAREKLAYIIDSTAAPVCILAPISSWAIAVSSEIGEVGGLNAFIQTIPYNLYAILTILFVLYICITDFDFGPMKDAQEDIQYVVYPEEEYQEMDGIRIANKGKEIDLIIPMFVLIISSVFFMAYVGGFFNGISFSEAIGVNPSLGLALGAFSAIVCALVLYIPRKIMNFSDFMDGTTHGVKNMISAILILVFAWSLSGVCREMLGTGEFISSLVFVNDIPLSLLPAIIFALACILSFSMGTAWGTFGILIPIVTMVCTGESAVYLIPTLGATLAGSVFGDHCSPISDTTILSSTSAKCEHMDHVSTQIPYAMFIAAISFLGYLVAGFTCNPYLSLGFSVVILILSIIVIKHFQKKNVKIF